MAKYVLEPFIDNQVNEFSDLISIDQTTYSIEDKWMSLAKDFFHVDTSRISADPSIYDDIDGDNPEISMLRTGLFGYVNAIASSEIKNNVYHRNVLYEEAFLNTASIPESIYNFAKLYNVSIDMATPAHLLANMSIRRYDLLNSPLRHELSDKQSVNVNTMKTYEVILDRDYEFGIGKFKYHLPYKVQIIMKQLSIREDDYSITARYLIQDNYSPYMDVEQSPELKVTQDMSGAVRYVHLQLDLFQTETTTDKWTITSDDSSANIYRTIVFKDQLANINVDYTYNNVTQPMDLYFNNTFTPTDQIHPYAYYSYLDDDKIQISFSSIAGNFRPKYGSQVTVKVETTKGEDGNFVFNDRITFNYTGDATDDFSPMITVVTPVNGTSSGGRDKLPIEQDKQKIIRQILGRDNLILEEDLKNYMDYMNQMNAFNGSSVDFLKKRDDLLKRVWSAFLAIRDNNGNLIQTNTAPMIDANEAFFEANKTNFADGGYVIPEHTLVYYNPNLANADEVGKVLGNGKYLLAKDGLDTTITALDENNTKVDIQLRDILDKRANNKYYDKNALVYATPFLTRISYDPILSVHYYMLDKDEDVQTTYKYINNMSPITYLINQVHIDRSINSDLASSLTGVDFNSDTWTLTFDVNTNEGYNQSREDIVVRGILMDGTSKAKLGYFEFTQEDPDNNPTQYTAHLSTDRSFGVNENTYDLNLTDTLINSDGITISNKAIPENLTMRIGVLYRDRTLRSNMDSDDVQLFMEDEFKPERKNLDGTDSKISDYALVSASETTGEFNLYRDLSNITDSYINMVTDKTDPWNDKGEIDINSDEFESLGEIHNLLQEGAHTWVAIHNQIKQVDDNGEAEFFDADGIKFTIKVIGANVYRYVSGKSHLYRMVTSQVIEPIKDATTHDFIVNQPNTRLNGLIALIPGGVYLSRYDKTFYSLEPDYKNWPTNKTALNGTQRRYEVYPIKPKDGSYAEESAIFYTVKDPDHSSDDHTVYLHYKVKVDGSIDTKPLESFDYSLDPNGYSYVAFYDGIEKVSDQYGKFNHRSSNGSITSYQLTATGLYQIDNGRRFRVLSSKLVDRSVNITENDDDFSQVLNKGNHLYMVLANGIFEADSLGLAVNQVFTPQYLKHKVFYPQNRQTRSGLEQEEYDVVDTMLTNDIDSNPDVTDNPIEAAYPTNTGEMFRIIPTGAKQGIYVVFPHEDLRGKLDVRIPKGDGTYSVEPSVVDPNGKNGITFVASDIYKTDMLGLVHSEKNFNKDSEITSLKDIWTGKVVTSTDNNFPMPGSPSDYDYVDVWNTIVNGDKQNNPSAGDTSPFSDYDAIDSKDWRIEMFPLVSADYMRFQHSYLYDILNDYIDVLSEIQVRLENNTSIDMKFVNSYGPSHSWYVSNRNVSNGNTIVQGQSGDASILRYMTRTDILFDFNIHLWVDVSDEVDQQIKDMITEFVEASRDDNVIAISNLTSLLEGQFSAIKFVEYNGLSGRNVDPINIIADKNGYPMIKSYNELEKEGSEDIINNRWQYISNVNAPLVNKSTNEVRWNVPEYPNVKKEFVDKPIELDSKAASQNNNVPYRLSDDGASVIVYGGQGVDSGSYVYKIYSDIINVTYTIG